MNSTGWHTPNNRSALGLLTNCVNTDTSPNNSYNYDVGSLI